MKKLSEPKVKKSVLEDGILPLVQASVKLPIFEGPLDLLLFLIKKSEIDIYDIPIEEVTEQYLEILYAMEAMNLDLAGEFFVMAATLMLIKSKLLLPKEDSIKAEESIEEEQDARWELVKQLLEYKKIKEESEVLESLIIKNNSILPRLCYQTVPELSKELIFERVDRVHLWNAFNNVLRRFIQKGLQGEIVEDSTTVADQINQILIIISKKNTFLFSELLESQSHLNIDYIVTAFLAILELSRLRKLFVKQTKSFSDILCKAVSS